MKRNASMLLLLMFANVHMLVYYYSDMLQRPNAGIILLIVALMFIQAYGATFFEDGIYTYSKPFYYLLNLWLVYSAFAIYFTGRNDMSWFVILSLCYQIFLHLLDFLFPDKTAGPVYYLASPYSHPDPQIMQSRYEQAEYVAYELICKGYTLIEPITSSHHKSIRFGINTAYENWKQNCRNLIAVADGVIVASTIDGWKESVGVQDEITIAKELGKPVFYTHNL